MGVQDFMWGYYKSVLYLNLIGQNSENPAWTPKWDFKGVIECGPLCSILFLSSNKQLWMAPILILYIKIKVYIVNRMYLKL